MPASLSIVASLLIGQMVALPSPSVAQAQLEASDPSSKSRAESQRPLTSREESRDSLRGAVTTPLRDVNLIKTDIPPILLQAVINPYARSGLRSCAALRKQIIDLNQVLGDDFDDRSSGRAVESSDRKSAYGVVATIVTDIIPMRSWIRKLSGAEQRDRQVQEAIAAGIARRSYLKGVGQVRGCKPPASVRTTGEAQSAFKG